MFSAKIYNYPGYNLKELPENIINYLKREGYNLDDEDEIPNIMKERSLLIVEYNGDILLAKWDGGEPEDQTFNRDLYWVAEAIKNAYKLGAGLENLE